MVRNASGNVLVNDDRVPRRGGKRNSSRKALAVLPRWEAGERRDRIVTAAADLFCENGFHETTVRQIADRVGILSGSLYHHFGSKEDIFEEIIRNYVSERREAIVSGASESAGLHKAISRMCTVHIVHVLSNSTISTIMVNEVRMIERFDRYKFVREAEAEVVGAWRGVLQSAVSAGKLHPDIDCGLIIGSIMTLINNALSYMGESDGTGDGPSHGNLDHIIDQILAIVFGIISPWLKS
jgi:AcrR family transcriptional regulator